MRRTVMFLVFLLAFWLITSSQPVDARASLSSNSSIHVPHASTLPVMDGKWSTPNEWEDASETIMGNESWRAYLRLKHNTTYIFVLIDFVSDQVVAFGEDPTDICGVGFDTSGDGGAIPKEDDYLFGGTSSSSMLKYRGTGQGDLPHQTWQMIGSQGLLDLYIVVGWSHQNDPYEGTRDHRIYELRIPTCFLGIKENYGFYAFVGDGTTKTVLEFPHGAGGSTWQYVSIYEVPPAPNKWGDIYDNFCIPEFPTWGLSLGTLGVISILALFVRPKKSHD